jgi:hypothetical protein
MVDNMEKKMCAIVFGNVRNLDAFPGICNEYKPKDNTHKRRENSSSMKGGRAMRGHAPVAR